MAEPTIKPRPVVEAAKIDVDALRNKSLEATVLAVLNQPQMTKDDKLMVLAAVITRLEGEMV